MLVVNEDFGKNHAVIILSFLGSRLQEYSISDK